VGNRGTEQRHHRVTNEFLDRTAEPFKLTAQANVIGREDSPNVLRIHQLSPRRETNEIGKQNSDDLPLLAHSSRAPHKRNPALRTELRRDAILVAA
jgi:hypothetical protein